MTALLLTPRILTILRKLSVSFKVGEVTASGAGQQFKVSPPGPLLPTVIVGNQLLKVFNLAQMKVQKD